MTANNHWLFPETAKEAIAAQKEMANQIILEDIHSNPVRYIAGMDVSLMPFDPEKMIHSAAVVLAYPDLRLCEASAVSEKQRFPYIPGLLGFREAPALVSAFYELSQQPDVIMVDGHGVSHPRGLGIASQLGILLDIPTIGVAKSILVGKTEGSLGDEPGSSVPLVWKGMWIGQVVRTKRRCQPLYISAGHKISLQTALKLVLSSIKGYRLPEPTRQAHLAANAHRTKKLAS